MNQCMTQLRTCLVRLVRTDQPCHLSLLLCVHAAMALVELTVWNCVNLAWSMESGVLNLIPSLGFTSNRDNKN